MPESLKVAEKACSAGGRPTFSSPPWPGKSQRAAEPGPLLEPVYRPISPITQSKWWSVYPRPTQSFGLGNEEFIHRRGFSVQPPDMTTTFASSVCVSPLLVSRQVTERATVAPFSSTVPILVTNASAIRVAALPPRCQRSAVSIIGTYELSVERFAVRLRGAPRGS